MQKKYMEPVKNTMRRLMGLRTIKTVLAVLLTSLFMHYVMRQTPFFACIGAVVAMERTMSRSVQAAITRNLGTLTGGVVGILIASLTDDITLYSLCLLPVIWLNNVVNRRIGKRESIVPGAIVYFAVGYLNTMETAWYYGVTRILGTFIGTLIAIAVNALIFPPQEEREAMQPLIEPQQ